MIGFSHRLIGTPLAMGNRGKGLSFVLKSIARYADSIGMKVICAWCKTHLKGEETDSNVSHGICLPCKDIALAAAKEWSKGRIQEPCQHDKQEPCQQRPS